MVTTYVQVLFLSINLFELNNQIIVYAKQWDRIPPVKHPFYKVPVTKQAIAQSNSVRFEKFHHQWKAIDLGYMDRSTACVASVSQIPSKLKQLDQRGTETKPSK